MKKLTVFFTFFALILLLIVPTGAANYPRVWDEAELLTDIEERTLITKLTNISEKHQVDVVVVTVESTDGLSPMAYADDFFDYNGYGFGDARDGVLLLLSMEERDWWISTRGYGITAFTDFGIEYIGEEIVEYLSDGDYVGGFTKFADMADEFITLAKAGTPFDVDSMPKKPFNAVLSAIIALIIGFIAGKVYTGRMKGELNTVRFQKEAKSYVKGGSFKVTDSKDFFLYRHLDRTVKESDDDKDGGSSTHTSSSGASHGGGGGKF